MITMMISQAMNDRLNHQITNEFSASRNYLAMMCSFDNQGLKMLASRFREQSDEEREHAGKLIDYVLEVGGAVTLEALPAPHTHFSTPGDAIKAAADHEREVTRQINELMSFAETEKDYATRGFLQWFVNEQVEEVSTMEHLYSIAKLAGNDLLQLESYVRHMAMMKAGGGS